MQYREVIVKSFTCSIILQFRLLPRHMCERQHTGLSASAIWGVSTHAHMLICHTYFPKLIRYRCIVSPVRISQYQKVITMTFLSDLDMDRTNG